MTPNIPQDRRLSDDLPGGFPGVGIPFEMRLLISAVLVGTVFRFMNVSGNLYSDEVWIMKTAASAFPVFKGELLQDWVHPPLYHFLARGVVRLSGLGELSGRFLSIAFGVCSIPLIYWVGKRTLGSKPALAAAMLLAFSPVHVFHSQYGRHYSLFVFMVLLSMLTFVHLYYNAACWSNVIFYSISNVLLVYTHYFGWLIVFCQLIYLFTCRRSNAKYWLTAYFLLFSSYIPWVYSIGREVGPLRNNRNPIPFIEWIPLPSWSAISGTILHFNGILPVPHQASVSFLVFGCLLLLSMKGMISESCEKRNATFHFAFYIVIPFIIVLIVSYLAQPVWLTRTMLFALPAYYLLVSYGSQQVNNKYISCFMMGIPILWMAASAVLFAGSDYRMPFEAITSYLEKESSSGSPIIIEGTYLSNPIFHYYNGDGTLYEVKRNNISILPEERRIDLNKLDMVIGRANRRLMSVSYTSEGERMIKDAIPKNYMIEKTKNFYGRGEESQLRNVRVTNYRMK